MKKYTFVKEIQPKDHFRLDKVECNKCGEEIDLGTYEMGGGLSIRMTGGYASKLIDSMDGEHISFDICDKCLIDFMRTFTIPASEVTWTGDIVPFNTEGL